MAEQILRTCYSFVIYNRDFSNALQRRQRRQRRPGQRRHRGACRHAALHLQGRDPLLQGRHAPGDVYAINDPYAGGTHFSDVRLIRPIFVEDEIIGYAQSNGHWSDMGGSRAGLLRRHGQGHVPRGPAHHAGAPVRPRAVLPRCRPPDRRQHARPGSIIGDMQAQAEATQVAARECCGWSANTARTPSSPAWRPCRTTSSAPCASGSRRCRTATWETRRLHRPRRLGAARA